MKDLDVANFIMGMEITRECANKKIWSNQRKYVEMILIKRFKMQEIISVKVPIPVGVKLFVEQCPKTRE